MTQRLPLIRTTAAAAALFTLGGWISGAPAQASYTASVVTGVLTLEGTSGQDYSAVTCMSATVRVDGVNPSTGEAACTDITSVSVDAHEGHDTIFLDDMGAADFPNLAAQTIVGGAGNDQLTAAPVPGSITAAGGSDQIFPGPGANAIDGGTGGDTVVLEGPGAVATGTELTSSTGGTDTLAGIEHLTLSGTAGGDTFDLTAFPGSSDVDAGEGDDTILGAEKRDVIFGGEGSDVIRGNDGADRISPDDGDDKSSGGPGSDTLNIAGQGLIEITALKAEGLSIGSDRIAGFEKGLFNLIAGGRLDASKFPQPVKIFGSSDDDVILSGKDKDVVNGLEGDDLIKSGGDSDRLSGEDGRDALFGGDGNDALDGGTDKDACHGGSGNNTLKNC